MAKFLIAYRDADANIARSVVEGDGMQSAVERFAERNGWYVRFDKSDTNYGDGYFGIPAGVPPDGSFVIIRDHVFTAHAILGDLFTAEEIKKLLDNGFALYFPNVLTWTGMIPCLTLKVGRAEINLETGEYIGATDEVVDFLKAKVSEILGK